MKIFLPNIRGHLRGESWCPPHYRGPPRERRSCCRCGVLFAPMASGHKVCRDCKPSHVKQVQKAWRVKNKDRIKQQDKIRWRKITLDRQVLSIVENEELKAEIERILDRQRGRCVRVGRISGQALKNLGLKNWGNLSSTAAAVTRGMIEKRGAVLLWDGPTSKRVYKFESD